MIFLDAKEYVKESSKGAKESLKESVEGAKDSIKEKAEGAEDTVKEKAEGAKESAKETGSNVTEKGRGKMLFSIYYKQPSKILLSHRGFRVNERVFCET